MVSPRLHQGAQLTTPVLHMAWAASVHGIQHIREGAGSRVADRAGCRKQSSRSSREQRAEQKFGPGRGSQCHSGGRAELNMWHTWQKVCSPLDSSPLLDTDRLVKAITVTVGKQSFQSCTKSQLCIWWGVGSYQPQLLPMYYLQT